MSEPGEIAHLQGVDAASPEIQRAANRGEVGIGNVSAVEDGGIKIVNQIDKTNPYRLGAVTDSAVCRVALLNVGGRSLRTRSVSVWLRGSGV